ncbi:MAG: hypothetical protein OES79_07400 [Planctomycetota bacterium]|nr:hypothetical protein [Planctomycetota bacterium]
MADKIPADCLTDGIDQTALLLMAEGHGRRNYMTHYDGGTLAAVRYEDFKVPIKPGRSSLPGIDFYNNLREPGEKYG